MSLVYCPEKNHFVGKERMRRISTAKANIFRICCIDCKKRIIEMRKNTKQSLEAFNSQQVK